MLQLRTYGRTTERYHTRASCNTTSRLWRAALPDEIDLARGQACEQEHLINPFAPNPLPQRLAQRIPTSHTLLSLGFFDSALLLHIIPPLAEHPYQASRRDKHRPRQPFAPSSSPKNQPFTIEMYPCYPICPQSELVQLRVGDAVGSVQSDDSRYKCVGAEDS